MYKLPTFENDLSFYLPFSAIVDHEWPRITFTYYRFSDAASCSKVKTYWGKIVWNVTNPASEGFHAGQNNVFKFSILIFGRGFLKSDRVVGNQQWPIIIVRLPTDWRSLWIVQSLKHLFFIVPSLIVCTGFMPGSRMAYIENRCTT